MPTQIERFEAKLQKTDGCWEWKAAIGGRGYGHYWFEGRPRPAHQVAFLLFKGPIAGGLFVLHKCDNRKCVNPAHLFLGTNAENMADMVSKRRQAIGSKVSSSKLTESQIAAIRQDQRSQRRIGSEYGVSHTTIGQIKSGQIWRHAA